MNETLNSSSPSAVDSCSRSRLLPIVVGLTGWVAISLGFAGLRLLMQERPQFVGQPLRASPAVLIQESPRLVARKAGDDVSVVRWIQPDRSEVSLDLQGRRDYRGLRTVSDMAGRFTAKYSLSNAGPERLFVLFQCAHPRADSGDRQGVAVGGLRMQASTAGVQEDTQQGWSWSGSIEPAGSTSIEVTYQVASLKGLTYQVAESNGVPLHHVAVTCRRHDLDSLVFESGDGPIHSTAESVVWERKDFLGRDFFSATIAESRNLFTALSQLVEIGPAVSLLFLLVVAAVILVRQRLTVVQMLTISAGYGLYFPLVLYLSARFVFPVALAIALVAPGVLLVNYARWLLGARLGLIGGTIFLGLYQLFPTLAVFAGWNRGLVLLCLGLVTLWVLINLQNRAFRSRAAAVAGVSALLMLPLWGQGAQVQVVLPGELAGKLGLAQEAPRPPLLACAPAQYQLRQEVACLQVQARLPIDVVRGGDQPIDLFSAPLHLQEQRWESVETNLVQVVAVSNRVSLFAPRCGRGTLLLSYRVPIQARDGKRQAQAPLAIGVPGEVQFLARHPELKVLSGAVWSQQATEDRTTLEIGTSGEDALLVEWPDEGGDGKLVSGRARQRELYGVGLTRARNLTIVNSDGSCTHFLECELPGTQSGEFRLRLPAGTRLISATVNGTETSSAAVENGVCRVTLPERIPSAASQRLSFRLAYPPVSLGFLGSLELALPDLIHTVGTLEWAVALPEGFDSQVISSGLETQKEPADLSGFGEYGQVLKPHPHLHLAKTLAPPGGIHLSLKYRQVVPGFTDRKPAGQEAGVRAGY